MKLWMSGEIQADVDDAFMKGMNAIEAGVNQLLGEISLEEKADEWDFIAIILSEDILSQYPEVVKKSSRGKSLEFRLRIPHSEFLSANSRQRIRLIFQALLRSVDLMAGLGVSREGQNTLRAILARAEKEIASTSFLN